MSKSNDKKPFIFTDTNIFRLARRDADYYIRDFNNSGFTLRVYPTGAKKFYYIYEQAGKKKKILIGNFCSEKMKKDDPTSHGLTTSEAKEKYHELLKILNSGLDPVEELKPKPTPPPVHIYTVQDLINDYIAAFAKKSKSPDNVRNTRSTLNTGLARLKDWEITNVRRKDVMAILDEYVAAGKSGQAMNLKKAGRACWEWADEREKADYNPFIGTKSIQPADPRERVLTHREIRRFWYEMKHFPPAVRNALRLILITAQRPGEVVQMRRRDIKKGIWIQPAEITKYKKYPHLAHIPFLADCIINPIFPTDDEREAINGDKICKISRADVSNALKKIERAVAEMEMEENENKGERVMLYKRVKPFTPHDLRRTASTELAALGCPKNIRNEILQHRKSKLDETYDLYEYQPEKIYWMKKWNDKLMEILRTPKPEVEDEENFIRTDEEDA